MSSFGTIFRVSTYGESHCKGVGCIVDGCPPGIPLVENQIQKQLDRRRPGQSNLTTPRSESDTIQIFSGTEFGTTLGTPIGLFVPNRDHRPADYSETQVVPRPSHADYTYLAKYGLKASSGGGRSSARETIGRVAAGAIAERVLELTYGVEIVAWVSSVGEIEAPVMDEWDVVTRDQVDKNELRCPASDDIVERMRKEILAAREAGDSIGGTVTLHIRNPPIGLGEPCFDKLEALLAHAMLSIPATKGFEIGSGFAGTRMRGSRHNDAFVQKGAKFGTVTNHSGGVQGGISNGETITVRVAFKPPATIAASQNTATYDGVESVLANRGRHDPCVVPRAVPIVEAMGALVILDALMIQEARNALVQRIPVHIKSEIDRRLTCKPPSQSGNKHVVENGQEAKNGGSDDR